MKISYLILAIAALVGDILLSGCISSNDEKIDESIKNIKLDSKIYFSVDTLFPDSNVTVNYSLGIHNLVVGDRYKIEVEFKSESNQFIQWYGMESFATDSSAMYLWSYPRKEKDQADAQIQIYLKINNIQLLRDTATYTKG
jgi:hypothetical protein